MKWESESEKGKLKVRGKIMCCILFLLDLITNSESESEGTDGCVTILVLVVKMK